jgi:hypothetical protein
MSLDYSLTISDRKDLNKRVKQSPEFLALSKFKYKSPKGYCEYNKVILNLSKYLFTCNKMDEVNWKFSSEQQEVTKFLFQHALNTVVEKGIRPYWITKPLTTAFLKTTPPKELKLKTKELGGIIFFPTNTFLLTDEEAIEWIFYYIHEDFILVYASPNKNNDMAFITRRNFSFILNSNSVNEPIAISSFHDNTDNDDDDDLKAWNEQSNKEKLYNLFFQTFLYIENYEPRLDLNYFSTSSPTERKTNKTHKQDASALIVGTNYHLKKSNSFSDSLGTGTSKATHWRSGHWRNQPYGSRENLRHKIIWLEPVLING